MLGLVGGGTLAYHGMTALGLVQASPQNPLPQLQGRGDGTRFLILGAGLAGMAAAFELRKVGYEVTILEYQNRAGGRCISLRGGDSFTEMGGATQRVTFQDGNYFNPGPWRIPYHHHAVLDYCRQFGVTLEPFIQRNDNAYVHRQNAPEPRLRAREVRSDFYGGVSELLAKSTTAGALNENLDSEDREALLEALRTWGVLDGNDRYVRSLEVSAHRGYEVDPADRLQPGVPSQPRPFSEMLQHGFWEDLIHGLSYSYQNTIFQPVGGMDQIARAFAGRVSDLITYGAHVSGLTVTDAGVQATYTDRASGERRQLEADYCISTIPLPIMAQMQVRVNRELEAAIRSVPYAPSVKAGIETTRRFWEDDEHIYGGITFTDLPIQLISYPSDRMNQGRSGVLLAGYQFGSYAVQYSGLEPPERLRRMRDDVARIHPQLRGTFRSGVTWAWHRTPWVMGCYGIYSDEGRQSIYEVLSRRHGRLMLAGEHISYWNGWMEGALLSSISAVEALHQVAQRGR